TDNGSSWTFCSGVANASIGALAVSDSNLFVSTVYDGTYRSTNNGISFKLIDVGNYDDVTSLAFAGSNIYAGTFNGSNDVVFLSTNSGTDWIVADSGLPVDDYVVSFGASGTNLFAGTYTGSIFLSANNGTSWNAVNTGLTNMTVNTFVVSGTNIFAGTQGGGVLLSINNGAKWTQVNTGLMDTNVYALAVSGHDLFAGTGHGVWRRSLNDMVTVVKENSEIPVSLSLLQNYPDPFNPTTTISFTIPSRSSVSLKIFDILGREVATIVSQELPAGTYSRQWNAAKMSSGIYFYRLQAGSFTQTKRLVLLK
ncbi:MAG: T9SS type A sorting domain-containing protein, partial [Bacteroidota bacterium]